MAHVVSSKEEIKRVRTFIKGLDENIEGGIPAGHIVLLSGSAGTMKSSVAFNILYNEALAGKSGIYISLEQSHSSILNHFISMGYDLSKVNLVIVQDLSKLMAETSKAKGHTGTLIIVDVGAFRKEIKEVQVDENRSWLNVIKNILKRVKTEGACDLFVLDSLSALYVLSKFKNPRVELFYLFEFLRDLDITSFLVSEAKDERSVSTMARSFFCEYDEDFLCDGIIYLRLTPFRRNIVREVSIVKMRTTNCNNDVFSLEFKGGQFHALYGGQNPLL